LINPALKRGKTLINDSLTAFINTLLTALVEGVFFYPFRTYAFWQACFTGPFCFTLNHVLWQLWLFCVDSIDLHIQAFKI
jgi:hypothetical protein